MTTERQKFRPPRLRPARELIAERLAAIPTRFGRLVYLARCRDRRGWYRHDGLATTHDARAVHTALLWVHEASFQQSLELPAWDQHEDLSEYLTGLNRYRARAAWSDSEPWHAIASPTAEPHERDLFAADFRALLRVLGASDRQGRKGKS